MSRLTVFLRNGFVLGAILSLLGAARADFTATYTFNSVTASSGLTDPTPVPTVANLTLGSFTAVGTPANPNATVRFSFTNWPLGGVNGNDSYAALTGALNPGEYFSVTLTPQPGFALHLTSLTFTIQRSGTGIRTYAVRSDAGGDAFATNLPASISPANANLSVPADNVFFYAFDANTNAQNGSTVTLTGANFQNITGPVTFRFYGWNAEASGGTFSIDNVTFNGDVAAASGPTPPAVTTPPSSQAVTEGAIVHFSVVAGGTAPLSYQWRKDTVPLTDGGIVTGAATDTLTLSGVTSGDAGSYDVVVTNAVDSVTSAPASLTVNPAAVLPPSITTEPAPQTVAAGGTATFAVVAGGTAPLAYQWRKDTVPLANGGPVSGATSPTLIISPVAAGDAGNYDVVVTNGVNPPATSIAVALTVTPPAPVSGDIVWNFGTVAAGGTPSSAPADVSGGELGRGNNNGATTPLLSTTSASSGYPGSSGQFNAGAAARIGALNTGDGGSAYFEFTLTPADNKELTPTQISFGSRSTGTGPQAWTLFSSLDGFTAPVATGSLPANSTWTLNTATLSGLATGAGLDLTFRLYGYAGAGNPATNTANWRIDDLRITGTTVIGIPIPPAVTAVAPANNAAGVLPGAAVTVTFSRPVLVSPGAFTLTGSLSGAHAVTVSGGPRSFTLTPATPFALGETVSLTVSAANVTNLSATAHLAADFTSSFTTLSPIPVPIHAVQGSDLTSSRVGETLVIQGIVVASFQGAGGVGGYYVEAPEAEWDADPATSEGILVFDNTNSVAVGDLVYVAGTVVEFGTAPATETELSPVHIFNKLSSGNPLPPAVEVTLPFPATGFAERYEGMLVTLPQALTVTDNFDLGHFGEVLLSNGRLPQPTNIVAPGAPAQAQLAANRLNQILLDDGISPAYPDPTPYLSSADPVTATRRTGSTAAGVTGAFGHKFGAYVIEPTAPVTFAEANPRPTVAPAAGPGLRVAIGNVLNFFNGDGLGGGFPTSRGANTFAEYQAQRAKIVAGILALAPDIMGLTEVENDRVTNGLPDSYGPTSAIADLVNGLNAGAPTGTTYAYVDASAVDIVSDVIHCAFIYRVETVAPLGAPAMLNDPSFTGVGIGIARNPLAQTFRQISNGEKLTVSINHFKSKGSATSDAGGGGAAANADSGDGQGASNHVRKLQAQALVNWLATDPTGSGDPDFLIIGDLNAYAKEDPIALIESAGYINLTEAAEGPGGYSYAFDGSFGHLDHALANDHLAGQVVDAGTWHVNSDEPVYLDYNFEDKSAAQQAINAGTPYRYSDHDPVVVRLNLQPDPVAPVITAPPAAQTTTTGASVTFSVEATGVPPPSYQWRRNGVAIDGATLPSYTIASPTSADAGSYDVVVTNGAGSVISSAALLTVNAAGGGITLAGLEHVYDGLPHPATVSTVPAGLPVTVTYNGSATPPTAPGWHTVVATINSPDYTGSATGLLFIDVTALVRHLPTLDGKVRGSVQLVTAENVTLNGNGSITGDLLVPGTPTIRKNGNPAYAGTIDGTGAASPASATITLNGGASLQHVVRRTPAQTIAPVPVPPAPTGTRNVSINTAGQSPGDFATIRDLTLNGNAGQLVLPAGTYGTLTANGSSSFVLGIAGATTPAIYNLRGLTLNGTSRLVIAGPVIINLANGTALNGSVGTTGYPEWVQLNIAAGGLTLNGNVAFAGFVTAPNGTITINGSSVLTGRIIADRLVVNGSGVLADPEF
jgi:predicted extracellular nuclease